MRILPTFAPEAAALARGHACVAGIDEVGRGPLAGPVVAAAVILDPDRIPPGIDDSKRLTARARERLDVLIRDSAMVAVGWADVEEIEILNVSRAAHLAMTRALNGLPHIPDLAIVDGPHLPQGLGCPAQALIGGDRLSLSIAAASIVAKVWRDERMVALARQHPEYGWESNKGYGSRSHIEALQRHGITTHHRRTFAPIHTMLWQAPNA